MARSRSLILITRELDVMIKYRGDASALRCPCFIYIMATVLLFMTNMMLGNVHSPTTDATGDGTWKGLNKRIKTISSESARMVEKDELFNFNKIKCPGEILIQM